MCFFFREKRGISLRSDNQVSDWDVDQFDGVSNDTDPNKTNTNGSDDFHVFGIVWFFTFVDEGNTFFDKF